MTGQPREPGRNRPTPAEPTTADEGGGAAITPLRRHRRSSTRRNWRIEQIRTETMTPDQYQAAVDALAVLVEGWHQPRPGDGDARSGGLDQAA